MADLGVRVPERPLSLASDVIPSVPVFRHIVSHFPCEVHVNYNINFPICPLDVFDRAIDVARRSERGESLSVPFAVWAHTALCLEDYGDPWNIRAERFADHRIKGPDVHTEADLLEAHRLAQDGGRPWWDPGETCESGENE